VRQCRTRDSTVMLLFAFGPHKTSVIAPNPGSQVLGVPNLQNPCLFLTVDLDNISGQSFECPQATLCRELDIPSVGEPLGPFPAVTLTVRCRLPYGSTIDLKASPTPWRYERLLLYGTPLIPVKTSASSRV